MVRNILTENDFKQIRGHCMGGKSLKIEREFLPEHCTLTVTVKESADTWDQKMIIRTESLVGCNYRSQYHTNLDSVKRFIAEDADFLNAKYRKKGR